MIGGVWEDDYAWDTEGYDGWYYLTNDEFSQNYNLGTPLTTGGSGKIYYGPLTKIADADNWRHLVNIRCSVMSRSD